MAPTRKNSEGLLARVNFPLYALQMLTNRHVLVAGGGGSSKSGVANGFEIFELIFDGKRFVAKEVMRHETGPKVVMNCASYFDNKNTFLVAGQESHCQLYRIAISVDKEDVIPENNKSNGALEQNNLRKRKSGKGNDASNIPESNKSSPRKCLKFKFNAQDSVQTDFSETEPIQRVIRISRCGKLMATGGTDGHVRLWTFPALKSVRNINAHTKELDDIDFSPDSKTLVSVSKDGKAFIWNVTNGKQIFDLTWNVPNGVKYLFKRCRYGPIEEDKRKSRIFTISNCMTGPTSSNTVSPGILHQWCGETGTVKKSVALSETLSALAVRDDGTFLAVGTMFTGSVAVYIAFSLQCVMNVKGAHSMFVTGLELLPSQGCSISSHSEAAVLSISVDNKICIHSLPYRRTLPPWIVIVLIMITLFCTFFFCSYIGL
ncbi:guanine nucleotide-exchange factor SEC12 [Rhodnius prolixus]|uniref:Putative prolactin regulatory element-binding protein/protein transport protein sec12p n=2 Tax=Rhodnius TaxID=13248 RepID=R4FNS0_RHOPR